MTEGTWRTLQLRDIATRITEKNQGKTDNVLTISAQYGLVSQTDFFNKSVASKNRSGYYYLKKGDFAYNKSYSDGYPFGAIKRLEKYEEGIVSTLYHCFRPNEKVVNSDFLKFYFDSKLWNNEMFSIAPEGGRSHGLLNVGVDDFFGVSMTIPPLDEQRKIASILTSVQDLIDKTEAIIKQTQVVKQGLMQRLFTKGIGCKEYKLTEIGEIPASWEMTNLGTIFQLTSGKSKTQKNLHPFSEHYSIPVYGGNGITGYTEEALVNTPILIIGRVGEYCGSVHLSTTPCWVTDNALYTKAFLQECSLKFLYHLLTYHDLKKLRSQTGQPLVSQKPIYEHKIGLPPIKEQKEIAKVIDSIDHKIQCEIEQKEQMTRVKTALMQVLLTGKVRVKIDEPSEATV